MRSLVFDPFAGISGDMTLGALLDVGLSLEWLRSFVKDLELGGVNVEVDAVRVQRCGIACTQLLLRLPHEHAHRHLEDVVRVIDATGVPGTVRQRAVAAFTHLAEAEAAIHGTTPDRVHFHEVGALDAIVDIVGTMAALEELGVERFYTRPVALGRGWADMAHGRFPVPPPAVLKLLEGLPVRDPELEGECTTPTGAAILKALTEGQGPPLTFVPLASGFGAGSRDPSDRPNCLRVALIEEDGAAAEALVMLQTDVDDMPPEYLPPLQRAILDAGALDCTVTPVQMKKGRPGCRIEALARPADAEDIRRVLFQGSTSIGVRWWEVSREALPRHEERIDWRGHSIRVKRSVLPSGGQRAKPEFEDVVRAAQALGIPPLAAYRAMLADGVAADGNPSSLDGDT
jgi:pyridinium-3,5-bisthiocarboxylic acid mononucleotide nickel chelatase